MKVGEFAKQVGVSVETVRYYHREDLLHVPESQGSYRLYTTKHAAKVIMSLAQYFKHLMESRQMNKDSEARNLLPVSLNSYYW